MSRCNDGMMVMVMVMVGLVGCVVLCYVVLWIMDGLLAGAG